MGSLSAVHFVSVAFLVSIMKIITKTCLVWSRFIFLFFSGKLSEYDFGDMSLLTKATDSLDLMNNG